MNELIKIRVWDGSVMEYIDDLYWFEENYVHDFVSGGVYKTPLEFMLWSGLLDENKQEIYAKDVIEGWLVGPDDEDYHFIDVVEFRNGVFTCFNNADFELLSVYDRLKKRGNIYENPELKKLI